MLKNVILTPLLIVAIGVGIWTGIEWFGKYQNENKFESAVTEATSTSELSGAFEKYLKGENTNRLSFTFATSKAFECSSDCAPLPDHKETCEALQNSITSDIKIINALRAASITPADYPDYQKKDLERYLIESENYYNRNLNLFFKSCR